MEFQMIFLFCNKLNLTVLTSKIQFNNTKFEFLLTLHMYHAHTTACNQDPSN